ncbi:hypothetical protein ABKN59_002637 [Abortiporus biennis]
MPPERIRYNAKARQSSAGGSSHKKKGKRKQKGEDEDTTVVGVGERFISDPNADIIVPKSQEQKELDRKEKLRQELLSQQESKVNSKKKKRLEKYIEKKLKQEERVVLFEKLSKTQASLPSALDLQSSSTLGTGYAKTHKERIDKEEDKTLRKTITGVSTGKGKRKRGGQAYTSGATDSEEEDFDKEEGVRVSEESYDNVEETQEELGKTRSKPVVVVDSGFSTVDLTLQPNVTKIEEAGSALRRNADGSIAAPRISQRKPKGTKTIYSSWKERRLAKQAVVEPESDSSFDSSDSEYDSKSEHDNEETSDANTDEEDGDNASSEEPEESIESEVPEPPKRKRLGFKEWAIQQVSAAKGYIAPVTKDTNETEVAKSFEAQPPPKKRKLDPSVPPGEMRGPLGADLVLPQTSLAKQLKQSQASTRRKVVEVKRPTDVEEARMLLPIVAEEQPIMEAILLNNVVIICGETGSGKTTQVPQFLYEAGFGSSGSDNPGMIGVTQPRRVAAMSMASRVAHELSLTSSKVSYQIRYDATVSSDTSIKFMTDGVLLRELATDFLLKKYSVIIIDEAHERSMNTDVLIGVLSRVIKLRAQLWIEGKDDIKPLRLIIMSATLRVSDFAENTTLFPSPPPIINVPARQHPVTVHFSRRTNSDYVNEAIRKTSKIHARLPPGGILIFLTGQNEITGVCKKLEARYGPKALEDRKRKRRMQQDQPGRFKQDDPKDVPAATVAPVQADVEAEDLDLGVTEDQDLALDVDDDGADVELDPEALDSEDERTNEELGIDTEETDVPMHVVPLYALLPSDKQMRVFQPPPAGSRLVVVSTNVAETSLTIPNIRYVVDCGRAKERRYDVANGIQAFQVSWISKASAAQRAGRAGRTGPGHCYRLYSSALYENYFEQFSQPEILRMPIEGVVLQMKSMHIDAVINFPFPTPPDRLSMRKAESILTHLGALTTSSKGIGNGEITDIGKAMSLFPLSPRYSRMLVSGRQHGCLPYVITMVSALSVGDPFLREEALEKENEEDSDEETEELGHLTSEAVKAKELRKLRRRKFFQSQQLHASLGNKSSDVLRILSVVGAYEFAGGGHKFCDEHFVRPKAMEEIHKLRGQISNIVQTNFPELDTGFVANLKPPTRLQIKILRQLLTAGFIDQVAARKDRVQKDTASGQQFTTSRGVPYRAVGIDEDVFIHPSSVLANSSPPEFVVFLEVVRTSRVYIKGVTAIHPAWLSTLGKSQCTFSKPLKNKEGVEMVIPHFGPGGWELPPIKSTDSK